MGGVSESKLKLLPGAGEGEEGTEGSRFGAVFEGVVSSEVGFAAGGFTSIRTRCVLVGWETSCQSLGPVGQIDRLTPFPIPAGHQEPETGAGPAGLRRHPPAHQGRRAPADHQGANHRVEV